MASLSITFGDQAENHKGMQKIGTAATQGISVNELSQLFQHYTQQGVMCHHYDLMSGLPIEQRGKLEASILVIRNGLELLFGIKHDDFLKEQLSLPYDTKAFMYGRVCNKDARHNLCFGPFDQDPDYEQGKGRVINFTHLPCLNHIRVNMDKFFGPKTANLVAESNLYHDPKKCGIGFHGDTERRIVVCFRLGVSIPLQYQWFLKHKPIGERINLELNPGDIYIMSEKAVGTDWKSSSFPTLRHAAGAPKFLSIK